MIDTVLWLIKPLPEVNWGENLEAILTWTVIAVVFICCTVPLILSYRRNRYCAYCRSKTKLGWRTEKIDARRKWVRVGSKWHYGGFVIQKTVTIRCPRCGWEIDLGK